MGKKESVKCMAAQRSGSEKKRNKNKQKTTSTLSFQNEEKCTKVLLRILTAKPKYLTSISLYDDTRIIKIPQFLTSRECKQLCEFATIEGFLRTTQKASKEYAFRDNDRLLLYLPIIANVLWERIREFTPKTCDHMKAVGLNPAIRFYRYNKDQRFGCHVDQSDIDPNTGYHSRYTVLVYLNDEQDSELQGGNTIFYHEDKHGNPGEIALSVAPKTGMALLHGHGDQCLLHEGAVVLQGAKYLLRTDVMYSY